MKTILSTSRLQQRHGKLFGLQRWECGVENGKV